MDNIEAPELDEISFGKEIAKSFVVSTAQTAGIYTGLAVVVIAGSKIWSAWEKRHPKTEPVEN